jgi:phosphotransferase system  glucose/maltose/N-acetylglucosamine-specific IIC component
MVAHKGITGFGFLLRLLAAMVLVFSTYNPSEHSYYHWVSKSFTSPTPYMAVAGILLLIGWTIYLRATVRSLGAFGLILAAAFFGAILWLVIDWGLVKADSFRAIAWIVLFILCGILAIGISWSHIRRRMTGQVDVDEVEGDI